MANRYHPDALTQRGHALQEDARATERAMAALLTLVAQIRGQEAPLPSVTTTGVSVTKAAGPRGPQTKSARDRTERRARNHAPQSADGR